MIRVAFIDDSRSRAKVEAYRPTNADKREDVVVQRDTPWDPGTPCWIELITTDAAAEQDFYRALFGWQIEVGGRETGNYGICKVNGREVAGIGGMQADDAHVATWSTYLATDDAHVTLEAAKVLGANVLSQVVDLMDLGRIGVFQLPSGGVVGVWQSGTLHGFGVANEPSAVTWNEFVTHDYEDAQGFYAALFGYQYAEIGDAGLKYAMMSLDGESPIGGIGELSADVPADIAPHWRVYFEVDDPDASAAKGVELGGSVLQEPQDMAYGRWAALADPQGAAFSVLRSAPAPA
jgi:predicted enzyme related to lactoylglutathione lyase